MDEHILPLFRAGQFSDGIVADVNALSNMAQELALPKPPQPRYVFWLWVAFWGLAVFTAVSLYRRGSSGWAWAFWTVVFIILGVILEMLLTRARSGSFGGGSFGGGFSGGGGASGGW